MAANLNPPSHFSSSKPKDSMHTDLLPPSAFEKHSSPDPWKQLSKATKDVMTLKVENEKLRHARHVSFPTGEEIKAKVDIPQLTSSTRHFDEIINRQAADILELRRQLSLNENTHTRTVARLESDLAIKQARWEQEIIVLKNQLQTEKLTHVEELQSKVLEYESKMEQQLKLNQGLEKQIHEARQESGEALESMREQLKNISNESEKQQMTWQQKIDSCDKVITQQVEQITQLKNYLKESEQHSKSTESWRMEVDKLKRKCNDLETEKERLEKSIEHLNVRITSQNEIMGIQEKELSKEEVKSLEPKKQVLLTRWREKVYSLLVQSKSADIVAKQEKNLWNQRMNDLEAMLETNQGQCQLLEHVIKDKEAQLGMERTKNERITDELAQAQQIALSLDDQLQETKTSLQQMADIVESTHTKYKESEATFQKVFSSLNSFSHRLSFASGRVEMLQGQFARREAFIKLELEKPTRDVDIEAELPHDSVMYGHVSTELERVTQERDRLVLQMKEDAQYMEGKINSAKQQPLEEIEQLKNLIKQLEGQIEEKNMNISRISEALEKQQEDSSEMKQTIEQLQTDLAKKQLEIQQAIDETEHSTETKFADKMAQLEHKLNDAKREQTKAVVSLRQFERQAAREKERGIEQTKTLEEFYKQNIAKLEAKLKSVEKDRNLLMATLRQEGLIGKYKSQRSIPLQLDSDEECDQEAAPTLDSTNQTATNEEPLHTVIDELKTLTQTALEDTDSSDND